MWVRLPGGYYNENAEVYLSWADIRAMAGITPEKVKKNEWILGVQGNFEGWVPNPQDLYYNGVNSAGLILLYGWTFENTRIAFYMIVSLARFRPSGFLTLSMSEVIRD